MQKTKADLYVSWTVDHSGLWGSQIYDHRCRRHFGRQSSTVCTPDIYNVGLACNVMLITQLINFSTIFNSY